MRILFNTVPVATIGVDNGSTWAESRVLNGSLTDVVSLHRQSGNNTGNFIHWEAPTKIIDFNEEKSRCMRLWSTISQTRDKDGLRRHIQENYDAIVISEANFIQKNTNLGIIAEFLSTIEGVEIYLFGAGIQDSPPQSFADVSDGTASFLKFINKKAALFGTRGPQTTAALNMLGLDNSRPIGCPSLFAYPKNMISIRKPEAVTRVCSAGHLTRKALENKDIRAQKIISLAKHVDLGYVFQTEAFGYTGINDQNGKAIVPNVDHGIYSAANGTLNPRYMKSYLQAIYGSEIDIREYMYFSNCDLWRTKMREYDIYIGDRFHGGVACMQMGIPTIFLKHDARVDELTGAIAAPSISITDFEPAKYHAIIEETFSDENLQDYDARYRHAHRLFVETLAECGLPTKNVL